MCAARETAAESLLSDAAQEMLRNTTELDYMTHIVFRMYENKRYVSLSSAGGLRNTQKVCKVPHGNLQPLRLHHCCWYRKRATIQQSMDW